MSNQKLEEFNYDNKIVKLFTVATIIWAGVGLLLGVFVGMQLAHWKLNFGVEWLSFGRLRPLHTNAAIFAFAGNAIFAGAYYSTQRLVKARMYSDLLSKLHFWGWQLIILLAAITLPLGITQGKEYAELEWPIDILVVVVWVIFAVNYFGTLIKRREKHLYTAIWFHIATIVTVAVLYIINNLEIPYSLTNSYPIFAGAQDALVQWWYGHNAVAFFLTTPFLGLMYYFVPKVAQRPIYSYRMSILHFWALVFIYIWAGPHHLLNTALPEWAQTLGVVFSVMLWIPSWAGMVNGLLTLRGVWDKVRQEPILKFFAAALTFYGMATFEGPLLSIKSVNALGHYTDWIVGHVHAGTLGWNGLLAFGMCYYLVPILWRTQLFSTKLANLHFYMSLIGIIFYVVSMWTAGITQGLMWRAINAKGQLEYPEFIETVVEIVPMYWIRAIGGTLYLLGFFVMAYNLWKTVAASGNTVEDEKDSAPAANFKEDHNEKSHRQLEALPISFAVLVVVAILVGTCIELLPTVFADEYIPRSTKVRPWTALELEGRDIYIKEGCYNCHSQMVRPFVHETLRYGEPSRAEESMYNRPFQWGSKRTGPDLARVGGKYPHLWHYRHMLNPRAVISKSIMPSYPWLLEKKFDIARIKKKLKVLQTLGVPYSEKYVANVEQHIEKQAQEIIDDLKSNGVTASLHNTEIIAMIAYLQALGKNTGTELEASND